MREGVNRVALRLFEHNEKAYRAAVRMMDQYGKAAIVHPTGTGKSYIAFKLIEDNPEKVVLWLSPSEYIFKTQLESLKRNDPDFPLANVHFYTYAKLMCCAQAQLDEIAAQKPAYIILDEFHRAGAECWGESTVALLKLCPEAKLLGLTATNIRYLDNNRDMAEELFDGHTASDMTLGEAVVRGILPAPKYVTTVYQYQKALAKYQARVDNLRTPGIQDVNQKYLDALRRALEQADGLDRVFAHHITNKSGKYIVFCANKEHMDEMVSHVPEWFAGVNSNVVVYQAYSDDPNTDKAFADFKTDTSDRLKLLFCIDMLNEGVHVEGISGVILFRPTISPIIYKQQIGRALTAGDNTTPLILDVVNNFEGLTSISGLQGEMQEAVHRLYANGEGDKIVTERFEVIEQVHDCRVLFEQLQASLSSGWCVMCSVQNVDESGKSIDSALMRVADEVKTGREVLRKIGRDDVTPYLTAWNKLYRRKLFNTLRYPAGRQNEDVFVFAELFCQVQRAVCVAEPLYFYRKRIDSIMNSAVTLRNLDEMWAYVNCFEHLQQDDEESILKETEKRVFAKLTGVYYRVTEEDRYSNKMKQAKKAQWNIAMRLMKQGRLDLRSLARTLLFQALPGVYGLRMKR